MFEKASRLQLRFESNKGLLTVEDLWGLPLTSTTGKANLDDIARGLNKQLKSDDVSFVIKDKKSDAIVQLKFEIVKRIIDVRQSEAAATALAKENAAKKQRILQLIAEKTDEDLKGKTLEELQAMAAAMGSSALEGK